MAWRHTPAQQDCGRQGHAGVREQAVSRRDLETFWMAARGGHDQAARRIELDMDASLRYPGRGRSLPFPATPKVDLAAARRAGAARTPLRLGVPDEWSESVVVTLPDGFVFLHVPGISPSRTHASRRRAARTAQGATRTFSFAFRHTCSEIASRRVRPISRPGAGHGGQAA